MLRGCWAGERGKWTARCIVVIGIGGYGGAAGWDCGGIGSGCQCWQEGSRSDG